MKQSGFKIALTSALFSLIWIARLAIASPSPVISDEQLARFFTRLPLSHAFQAHIPMPDDAQVEVKMRELRRYFGLLAADKPSLLETLAQENIRLSAEDLSAAVKDAQAIEAKALEAEKASIRQQAVHQTLVAGSQNVVRAEQTLAKLAVQGNLIDTGIPEEDALPGSGPQSDRPNTGAPTAPPAPTPPPATRRIGSNAPITFNISGGVGSAIPVNLTQAELDALKSPTARPAALAARFRFPFLTSKNNRLGNVGFNVGLGAAWAGRGREKSFNGILVENSSTRYANLRTDEYVSRAGLLVFDPVSVDWESPRVKGISFYGGAGPVFGRNDQRIITKTHTELWDFECPGGTNGTRLVDNTLFPVCPGGWNGTQWDLPTLGARNIIDVSDSVAVSGNKWSGTGLSTYAGLRVAIKGPVAVTAEWQRMAVDRIIHIYKFGLSLNISKKK